MRHPHADLSRRGDAGRAGGSGNQVLVAGIDVGTTNCRCLLLDEQGAAVAAASVEVPIEYAPPDRAEVQPERWWEATLAVLQAALEHAGCSPDRLTAIGLSGLMHAPVLVDQDGRALAAAQLWLDQRCAPEAEALRSHFADRGRRLDLRTSVSAPKLAWIAAHSPSALAQARAVLLPKDFVRMRLTGDVATDSSDAAGTGLYDPDAGVWMEDVALRVGVRPEQLPRVRRADELAGVLSDSVAATSGLRAGIPVATGGADTLCTRLGAGRLDVGRLLVYLGTAAWVAVVEGVDEVAGLRAIDAGATTASGAALGWVRDLLSSRGPPLDYGAMDGLAACAPIGSGGVTFLPHLMGERGPEAAPGARAAWSGLTLAHRREHLVRAVMEGVTFQLRRLLESSVPGLADSGAPVFTVGGICRSAFWSQMLADVIGLSLEIPRQPEAAAQGAALLGARAAGLAGAGTVWPNPVDRLVEPDTRTRAAYGEAYQRFRSAERACSQLGGT